MGRSVKNKTGLYSLTIFTMLFFLLVISGTRLGYSSVLPSVQLQKTTNQTFNTFLGGSNKDIGTGIVTDTNGNIYVTGETASADFPTKNAFQASLGGSRDVFITKYASNGSLLFSTYLGGSSYEYGPKIAVDNMGNVYVTGSTESSNFPVKNATQNTFGGTVDVFVTKLNATGSIVFSTYLGAGNTDQAFGIAVDNNSDIYITGLTNSANFPLKYSFQSTYGGGNCDVFVTKLNATGSILFSTFLGGNGYDQGYGIAVDKNGNSYVTGQTESDNFPIKNAYQSFYGGAQYLGDAFVTKFNASGSLMYSTYLGGSGDEIAQDIVVDGNGNSYIIGFTQSTDFPTVRAYQNHYIGTGDNDMFVSKFDSQGNLLFSTYLGGSGNDVGYSIAVDRNNGCIFTGSTMSADFPMKNAYNSTFGGGTFDGDAIIGKFDTSGNLVFSSYLGGSNDDAGEAITTDTVGNAFVTGYTQSTNFPVENANQSTLGGNADAFIAKYTPIDFTTPTNQNSPSPNPTSTGSSNTSTSETSNSSLSNTNGNESKNSPGFVTITVILSVTIITIFRIVRKRNINK